MEEIPLFHIQHLACLVDCVGVGSGGEIQNKYKAGVLNVQRCKYFSYHSFPTSTSGFNDLSILLVFLSDTSFIATDTVSAYFSPFF